MKPEDSVFQSTVSALLSKPGLPRHIRIFSWLSASVALSHNHLTYSFIELAFEDQIAVLQVKEIILQNYLFCGFPNAIEGLLVLSRVLHEKNMKDENYEERRDNEEIQRDGLNLCQRIYGKNYVKLIRNIAHVSTDLSEWMVTEGYGKVLSRPILTPHERELSVVSALAVLQRERQLISHIRGAVHVGARREEIAEVFSGLSVVAAQTTVLRSLDVLDETLKY